MFLYRYPYFDEGDFSTPERYVPQGNIFTTPTEACDSLGRQAWGYRVNEDYFSKNKLKQNIDKIFAMGGNYLLNVGPTERGEIPLRDKETLADIGRWYKAIKSSFDNAVPAPIFTGRDDILATANKNEIYVHVYEGLSQTGVVLDPITEMPKSVELLNTGEKPKFSLDIIPVYYQREDALVNYLHVYDLPCDEIYNEPAVLKIVFDDNFSVEKYYNKTLDNSQSIY